MKKLLLILCSTAALVIPAIGASTVLAPAANAATPVTVSAGLKWTPTPGGNTWFGLLPNWCTMTAVGTDDLGNKIGITAGHCVANQNPGAKIHEYKNNLPAFLNPAIGELVYKDTTAEKDYAIIKFYNDRVVLDSTTPGGLEVTHVAQAVVGQHVQKDGATTGVDGGDVKAVNGFDVRTTYFEASGGDSGAPLITDDGGVVARLRGPEQSTPISPATGLIWRGLPDAIAEIPAGAPGHGFVHVNN